MAKRYHTWYNQRCDRGRGKESGIVAYKINLKEN